ncbi:MAG: hypothetical protein JWO94_187 [Verrucomicrobiaceae bacterium]|nr:hypothetical protein [Verrucomicrobiaceae bacterium]
MPMRFIKAIFVLIAYVVLTFIAMGVAAAIVMYLFGHLPKSPPSPPEKVHDDHGPLHGPREEPHPRPHPGPMR